MGLWLGDSTSGNPQPLVPAQAGTQSLEPGGERLDSRLRGNERMRLDLASKNTVDLVRRVLAE